MWRTQVNDTWWGDRGNEWDGTNLPFLFQWAITRADKTLDGSVSSLPVFTALRKCLIYPYPLHLFSPASRDDLRGFCACVYVVHLCSRCSIFCISIGIVCVCFCCCRIFGFGRRRIVARKRWAQWLHKL